MRITLHVKVAKVGRTEALRYGKENSMATPIEIHDAMITVLPKHPNNNPPRSSRMSRRDLNTAVVDRIVADGDIVSCVKIRVGNILALYSKKRARGEPAAIQIHKDFIEYWVNSNQQGDTVEREELEDLDPCE